MEMPAVNCVNRRSVTCLTDTVSHSSPYLVTHVKASFQLGQRVVADPETFHASRPAVKARQAGEAKRDSLSPDVSSRHGLIHFNRKISHRAKSEVKWQTPTQYTSGNTIISGNNLP